MAVLLFPGQGSQFVGMLEPWLALPGARDTVKRWSHLAGVDLASAGTSWSDEDIRDTAVAQPLLVATALLSARALLAEGVPDAVCGHSVGELPALAVAGILSDDDVITLASVRGRLMSAATKCSATGLAAILGGDAVEVLTESDALGLEVATVNTAGQVVVGGPVAALDALAAAPPRGARVRRLDVAGAFHTSAMAGARAEFALALQPLSPSTPRTTLIANRDGGVVTNGREAVDRLAGQLTMPVRFDLCLRTLSELGVTSAVEVAPGGTLTALAKRGLHGAELAALRTPADVPAAQAMLHRPGEHVPVDWCALPSPDSGIVDLVAASGSEVRGGDAVAVISGRSGAATVRAPRAGTVTEWLVSAGDPVRAGQLLAVLG